RGRALPTDDACERLDEHRFLVRDRLREFEEAMLHVDRRHANELREPARIEVRRAQRVADGLVAREAIAALAAGDVVRDKDAVAALHGVYAGPDFDDFRGDLVSEDERGLGLPIPLHDVGPAYATRPHAHEDLA